MPNRSQIRTPMGPDSSRYDRPGHLDEAHADRLLEMARASRQEESDQAFLDGAWAEDDFAEELGETAVSTMTSGDDVLTNDLAADVEEETGGPFLEVSANREFAGGLDESNTADATREPLPLANREEEEEEES